MLHQDAQSTKQGGQKVTQIAQRPQRHGAPLFTLPIRQLVLMLIVGALVAAGGWLIYPAVSGVFLANPWLNGFIVFVFLVGVFATFWQVLQIWVSVGWIEDFVAQRPGHDFTAAPRLLASLAALLRSRGSRVEISASSGRSILDSVATRIDEARDITRYLGNLLILFGLLGTFWGLATTIPAIVDTIRSLAPQDGQTGVEVFDKLMTGLEAQLGGMGTAFSSSLIGLAGSLVVGLLELFASHGQNRFFRELEEWLSSITRLGLASGESDTTDQSALVAVLDGIVTRLEAQEERASEDRAAVAAGLQALAEGFGQLSQAGNHDETLTRLAEGQDRLIAALQGAETGAHVDAESRMRLRSMDVQLLRIYEEIAAGRQETMASLHKDLRALTDALRNLAGSR
jgi:hypothetical protein